MSTSMKDVSSMKDVIPIANQLQELLVTIQDSSSPCSSLYELPQIAVIGNQSVGKSSVLEALMGVSCLPRGTGMVTKCPLILQLKSATQDEISLYLQSNEGRLKLDRVTRNPDWSSVNCYVQFSHLPEDLLLEEKSVHDEIVRRTRELCAGADISHRAIMMKMTSTHVTDLTLIDLPGLIRVPDATQPPDIDEQIKKLVLSYVRNNKCIVLAVSAANVDLANSDSLRIAREVDPQGIRTIGVLTKADLIDDPSMIVNILEGRLYPLRRGYVPVKCRSSSKAASTQDILKSLKEESDFFRTSAILKDYKCGTEYLAKKLNDCLFVAIKQFLPTLKSNIETAITSLEAKVQILGRPVNPTDPASGALVLDLFTRYTKTIDDLLDGRATTLVMDEVSSAESASELVGGARLHYIFHDWFAASVMKLDPLAGLSDKEIRTAIRNASGFSTSLFVPENAFEMLVKKQIKKLEQPAAQCVYQARQEMLSLIEVPLKRIPEFQRFTVLQERVRKIARQVVDDHLNETSHTVQKFIQIELAFINKSHPDFLTGKKAIQNFLIATAGQAQKHMEDVTTDTVSMSGVVPRLIPPETPTTTGVSDPVSDPESASTQGPQSQSFLTFWRRHPLQQSTTSVSTTQPQTTRLGGGMKTRPPPQAGTSPLSLPAMVPDFYQSDVPERDALEVDLVKVLISSYFNIVKKTLADIVPKTIMHLLVNASNKSFHGKLVTLLYRSELFSDLLQEHSSVPAERQEVEDQLKTFRRAHEILASMRKNVTSRSPRKS
eukprot:Blabericola_migrator_1__10656@NODE_607_length_7343_cov_208_169736_g440_i0_p2_GENE_NODE_607_length_7343_cov_208_169736_g440_i0NODE_607_length_7343_cov_208_169736_g440_i0_p2_ORF_typecomplete_len775_score198_62Dynamin_M/PF01031_20/3_2e61Dynamin_N/PF00350_23/5_4e39GED/PF02212_18/4_4e22FeoB_N/PF02421_18/0_21FeoB_N/PF02421_18/0_00067MMR_HSR1/PF01926_23/2_1e06RsgA_GTPase/PF03193_16/2_1RsgA_GTPase/PF03193_16/0_15AIG1/PF04548_16/6_9AIG1/PF04548_16/0_82GTP_EFTU/PF00009_27/0_027IIGP/PF05049_13/0_75IIGP/PF0